MKAPRQTRTLTPSGFGLELLGLDLSELPQMREVLLALFHDSGGLILIKGQTSLQPERLCQFAAGFGTLERNEKYDPNFLLPGVPEILRVGNLKEGEGYRSLFVRADPEPLLWHCDDSFRDPQPIGSCLFCVETPPSGGETWFAGTQQAYDAFDIAERESLASLSSVHSYDYLNEFLRQANPHRPVLSDELRRMHPPVRRPLVAEHPETGRRGFYVPRCHMESVDGLTQEEGGALLDRILKHTTSEPFRYQHRWEPGDLVVWDNRSALHAACPFDDRKHQRLLYRLTMMGRQIVGF